jgi:hypothetical protein
MKNKTLSLALIAFLLLLASVVPSIAATPAVPWFTPPKGDEDPAYDSATREKLKTLKVSIQWDNVSLKAALDDLTSQSKKVDPAHEGVKFTYKLSSDDQKISMTLGDATLDDVLGYLSAQTNLRVRIHKGEVVLLPLK